MGGCSDLYVLRLLQQAVWSGSGLFKYVVVSKSLVFSLSIVLTPRHATTPFNDVIETVWFEVPTGLDGSLLAFTRFNAFYRVIALEWLCLLLDLDNEDYSFDYLDFHSYDNIDALVSCLYSFEKHAVRCKGLSGFNRHNIVSDVIFDNWKHACVDLTGVSPLMELSSRSFTTGEAALKASASCKVTKHEKTCIENQHMFILFAFDTFVFLTHEAVELLNGVQWIMNIIDMIPRSIDVVFKKINFEI
ncbi:hypothetical protein Tco_0503125 [Tanacetum coccineum]